MTRYVLQSLSEFLERGGHDCRTICEVSPPDVRGISHVRHQSIRMSLQIARVAVCQRGERLRGPRRDRQHVARPLHDLSPLAFGGRFLEDHMRELVPPNPKELTAPLRNSVPFGHARSVVGITIGD